jgi:hypothetical protein
MSDTAASTSASSKCFCELTFAGWDVELSGLAVEAGAMEAGGVIDALEPAAAFCGEFELLPAPHAVKQNIAAAASVPIPLFMILTLPALGA